MRLTDAVVYGREAAWATATRIQIHLPDVPHIVPGQYLLAGPAGRRDWLLPRPLLAAAHDPRSRIAEILLPDGDANGGEPAHWPVSAPLAVLGPLGHPFTTDRRSRRALLVGAPAGLGPLLFLARTLVADGLEATLIALKEPPGDAMPATALPREVEYLVVPRQDGSLDALTAAMEPLIPWADALYLALPSADLPGILSLLRRRLLRLRKGYAQALLLPGAIPCGVGACDLCPVQVRAGTRRLCRDGLVFDLLALI